MPLGYKYVQRDADSNINWAEVGKSLSDVLLETNRVREEKKTAIDQSIRESLNNLANSPQGINQDVNNFLNNYTSDMSAQILLDKKLLQSGQMDLKDWTLRQQNYKDGTDQMFNLSKTYQEKSKEIMDGIDNNEIQSALGFYNMGTIEGFTNFNNSRATINSIGDGKVSLALMENKIIDGKEVRVLSKNNMPVNVLLGQIHNQPKKFDVEGTTAATAKAFGTRFQAVYKAASTAGAGTITELLGIESMKKYPKLKPIVDEMNKAIKDQVDSNLSNPLNVISVLGENTGNYSSESFTYDKDEAAKDPKKILLTIDPRTQTATMDENAPHYKKQYEEAAAWVKTSLMSKLDSEAKISTTGQLSAQYAPEYVADNNAKLKENINVATMIGTLYAGSTSADIQKATNAFRDINPLIEKVVRTTDGVEVTLMGPDKKIQKRTLSFYGPDGGLMSQQDFIESAAPLLAGNADWKTAVKKGGYIKNGKFNDRSSTVESTVEREAAPEEINYTPEVTSLVRSKTKTAITADDATGSALKLNTLYRKLGFTFKPVESGFTDQVIITAPDGTTVSGPIDIDNLDNLNDINQFIIDNSDNTFSSKVFGSKQGGQSGRGELD